MCLRKNREAALQRSDDPGIAALARQMEAHGKAREGPVRSLSAYVGDRWSVLMLLVLETGCWRHAALRRVLCEISHEGAISQRILTLKLRSLERDGLVGRMATDDVPPHVSYRLTRSGEGFVAEVRRLLGWIEAHAGAIEEARRRFDAD